MSRPTCPACNSTFTYKGDDQYIFPECAHEWRKTAHVESAETKKVILDARAYIAKWRYNYGH